MARWPGGIDTDRKYLISVAVVFVVWMLGSMVVRGTLLQADYAALPSLFWPPAEIAFDAILLLILGAVVAFLHRGCMRG